MEGKESKKARPRRKTLRRIIQIILGLFVILLLFIVFAVPAILSSGPVRQIILSKINDSVPGKTDFSGLSVGWLSGVKITDLSYDDKTDWISVKVKNISTQPHYGALLTGNLNFGQTQVDIPQVVINMKNKPSAPAESKSAPAEPLKLAIATNISLKDGSVKFTGTDSKTVVLAQINSDVNIRPAGEQSSFNLGMVVAANNEKAPVEVKGQVTPSKKSGWTMKGATGNLVVDVNKLDLESLESIYALAGVDIKTKGVLTIDLKGKIQNGQLDNLTGTAKGSNLDISAPALNSDSIKTKVLDADVKLTGKGEAINIDNLNVLTDWASLKASGQLPTTIKSLDSLLNEPSYNLNVSFNCNAAALVSQMPKTLGLKKGTTITSGSISGDISTPASGGKKQLQAVMQFADLKGSVEGKNVALSEPVKLQALVSPEQDGLNINKMDLTASFAGLNCSGNLKSIQYNARTDLAKLQTELGQFVDFGPYKIAGTFASNGNVSLGEENYSANGSVQLDNLLFSAKEKGSVTEPKATVDFDLSLDKKNDVLTAQTLKANAGFGQFSANGACVPLKTDSAEQLKATILASNVDLSKLKPYAIMFASLPKEMQLSGIAQSELLVSSAKQVYTVKTDSTKIKDLKLTYPGKKPFDQNNVSVTFDTELDPKEQTYEVRNFTLESPVIKIIYSEFSQSNMGDKTKMQGQADIEYDWSALTALLSEFIPEQLMLQGKMKDKISFSSEYPIGQTNMLLANLNAKVGFGFQQADYMGLDFGPTDVKIDITKGVLQIPPFSTTVNDGKLNFAVMADFKKQPVLFETPKPMQVIQNIQINDKTTGKLLKYLNPIFANASNVSGIANLSCDKLDIPISSAAKNDALIEGVVSMNQLRLQTSDLLGQIITVAGGNVTGVVITVHPTKFTLKDGVLSYDDMEMDVGKYPVNFAGYIGLDKSLNMTVTLPYTLEGRTVRVGQQSMGRITLPLTGTVDKPGIDLKKLLELQLKSGLEDQLKKGLENLFK
jgi:hypothetical protein